MFFKYDPVDIWERGLLDDYLPEIEESKDLCEDYEEQYDDEEQYGPIIGRSGNSLQCKRTTG